MSLVVYTDKSQIPSTIEYVNYNDKFFQAVPLTNTEPIKTILNKIDKAEFNSDNTFIGRDKDLGALNKQNLSTGCKTLINIVSNPEMCFDVVECGQNALELLHLIDQGYVLWKNPVLHMIGNKSCNIEIDGRKFSDFNEFLSYVMDGE